MVVLPMIGNRGRRQLRRLPKLRTSGESAVLPRAAAVHFVPSPAAVRPNLCYFGGGAWAMPRPLPRDLRKALDRLEAEPNRPWRVEDLAAISGVARRPRVRQELLRASPGAGVAEVAERCGITHLGRFATRYRERYGESPAATLRRRSGLHLPAASLTIPLAVERPTIAVLPFDLIGPEARRAAGLPEEIVAAIWRLHCVNVITALRARYHLRGKVR